MIKPNLDTVALGPPIERLCVWFFPLYLPGNDLPAIATGDASGLFVNELETASVQELRVTNPTDKPVLVVEGEHFLGGKQNRAVNASVLVGSLCDAELPVSCLEQGRWGRRRAWSRAEAFAPARIRAAQRRGVARSMRDGSRAGDQCGVWSAVSEMLAHEDVESETEAAADLQQAYRRTAPRSNAVEELVRRGPLPGQSGIGVARGGRVTAMDLFGAPQLLAAHWGRLIRSHYVESKPPGGRPSADRMLALIRHFARARARAREVPGVGLGMEQRISDGRLAGQALTLRGAVVHAAFSRTVERGENGHA